MTISAAMKLRQQPCAPVEDLTPEAEGRDETREVQECVEHFSGDDVVAQPRPEERKAERVELNVERIVRAEPVANLARAERAAQLGRVVAYIRRVRHHGHDDSVLVDGKR